MRKGRVLWTVLLCAVLFGGCTPTRYVPVETVRTEYRDKDNSELLGVIRTLTERLSHKERQVDSLMRSHNERLVLNDRGDTLRHDRETVVYRSSHREKELERLVESKTDSIRELVRQLESVKADSIPVPYPVEQQLSRWEYTRLNSWWWIATALALCAGWICRKPIIGLARRIISKN